MPLPRPGRPAAATVVGRCLPALLLASLHPAQAAPAGFVAPSTFADPSRAASIHGTLFAKHHGVLLTLGGRLELHHPGGAIATPVDLGPNEDISCLCLDPGGDRVTVLTLRSGRALQVDLARGRAVGAFAGVANAFDAIALDGGALLVNANPSWPAPGANAGLWLVGPGVAPRLVLPLIGPSGPLLRRRDGDLVVAELGPIVPPPPGAARLLRIPAARLQAALQGATLGPADVVEQATGYGSLYDLAEDDEARLYASDSGQSQVVHTASSSLVPIATAIDVGAGRSALHLQFVPDGEAPFRAFQPTARAGALRVAASDFFRTFEVHELRPARPTLAATPGAVAAGASATLSLGGAPAHGFAVVVAAPAPGPEHVAARLDGSPLWLCLGGGLTTLAVLPLDSRGTAAAALANPGGIGLVLHLQAVALLPTHPASSGSSGVATVHLLP